MTLTRKPIDEIKTEMSRKTIAMQHEKFGKTIGINGCFGSSNLGQMTGFIPRWLVQEIPNAFMRCPLALWPEVEGASQVLLYDDYQVVIDGCKERCLLKTLEKAGVKVDLAYALDEDFGLEKAPGPGFDEKAMNRIAERIKQDVQELASQETAVAGGER